MALFKHPGTFKAGAAQCSVADWAHYNHGYTARILDGSPAEDTASYKASPIYYAAGFKDRLLLQHGLIDGNVEYQDAVRLVQRLMELGKDFEFVTYPMDEYGCGRSGRAAIRREGLRSCSTSRCSTQVRGGRRI